jgi:hypothetical protein
MSAPTSRPAATSPSGPLLLFPNHPRLGAAKTRWLANASSGRAALQPADVSAAERARSTLDQVRPRTFAPCCRSGSGCTSPPPSILGSGTLQLYRNGQPLAGVYTLADDPWQVSGGGDFAASPTNPRGIKIGGSFPQNTVERNPCNCRMDSLMFIERAVTQVEMDQQYRRMVNAKRWRR